MQLRVVWNVGDHAGRIAIMSKVRMLKHLIVSQSLGWQPPSATGGSDRAMFSLPHFFHGEIVRRLRSLAKRCVKVSGRRTAILIYISISAFLITEYSSKSSITMSNVFRHCEASPLPRIFRFIFLIYDPGLFPAIREVSPYIDLRTSNR